MKKTELNFNLDALPLLANQDIPASIVTGLQNRGIIDGAFLNGINTMYELEKEIMGCIEQYAECRQPELLQKVFHLIQIWGGNSGRFAYINNRFNWNETADRYLHLVNTCLEIKDFSEENRERLISMIQNRSLHIPGIGYSFATKHIHFWLRVNLNLNALPIYDRRMSQAVLHERQSADGLRRYWTRMIALSAERNHPLSVMERLIFKGEEAV